VHLSRFMARRSLSQLQELSIFLTMRNLAIVMTSFKEPDEPTNQTYFSSSFGCLLLERLLMTTKVRMVKPRSQRLGRP